MFLFCFSSHVPSWPRGEKRRKTRPDIARRRERGDDTGKVVIAHGSSVEFCEATPIGLADESKESLYGRETDRDLHLTPTCVAPRHIHVDASRDFFLLFFSERAAWGEGGGGALPDFFFFPCSADHDRDWPPSKVFFFGLATNTLNVRNNYNNNLLRLLPGE